MKWINTEIIAEAATGHTIVHNLGNKHLILSRATPNWNTDVAVVSRAKDTIDVVFSAEAPSGGKLDVRIVV